MAAANHLALRVAGGDNAIGNGGTEKTVPSVEDFFLVFRIGARC